MSKSVTRRGLMRASGKLAAAGVLGNLAFGAAQAAAQSLGPIGALAALPPGTSLPPIRFVTGDGALRSLGDYRGQGLVLNLWATWCGPCVAELPTLDRLAPMVAPDGILVLPISSDAGGAATVRAFYDGHGIDHLPVLTDPDGAILSAWNIPGIPTTVIFDRGGTPRARLIGAADWGTAQAVRLVRRYAGGGDAPHAGTVRL
ncbi:TlpA disulfide reductase family protein [Acidisoma sp. C75]